MKQIITLLKNLFQNKTSLIQIIELFTLATITFGFLIYITYTNTLNGDEREHIYASYLIHKGYIPYRDFFEHHHPLLWYMFQPIIYFFINNANIWYAARTFSLLLIIIYSIFIFKISRFIYPSSEYSWLTLILSLCPHCVFISQTEFRPDALMMTTFIGGLYYYLLAIKTAQFKNLIISFTLFFLSLMALQKICFLILPIVFLNLYLMYKHIFNFKNILKASLLPIGLTTAYLFYLYQINALKDYFELNWLLNIKIHFGIQYPVHQTYYYYLANILALITLFTSKNIFLKYIAFIGLFLSIILTYIFIGAFRHYWLPLYPFFALVCAYYVTILIPKIKIILLGILIYLIFANNLTYTKELSHYTPLSSFVYLTQNILTLSHPNDLIIGCIGSVGGLRLDSTGYYWFGRNYIALLDNHYFHRHELPNGDKIVKARSPKIICAEDWTHCMTDDYKFTLNCHSVPTYDRNYLDEHYNNMGFIYVKK